MNFTTDTYLNGQRINQEKLCTLKEFLEMGRLKIGQKLHLAKIEKDKSGVDISFDAEDVWIGDATPYHEPSTHDAGFGWDRDSNLCKKFVTEIHTFKG